MLSDTAVKNAKAKDKPYKLADEKGLYIYVIATSDGCYVRPWLRLIVSDCRADNEVEVRNAA
jgi:hypothetical protein